MSTSVKAMEGRFHGGETRKEAVPGTACEGAAPDASREAAARTHAKAARRYFAAAAGCALFALVYAQFSHGVYSPFMTFMFAIPLVGGTGLALACSLAKVRPLPSLARQAWALAIACLTVGSCLKGVFEIAGTDSALIVAYPLAACALVAVAVAAAVRAHMRRTTAK